MTSTAGRPPDAPRPQHKAEGANTILVGTRINANSTARLTSGSPTLDFLRGRERVLGRRFWLSIEPVIAAQQLIEARGPLSARAWVRELLAELEVM